MDETVMFLFMFISLYLSIASVQVSFRRGEPWDFPSKAPHLF